MLNFTPEWDDEAGTYADDRMLFDLDALLDSTTELAVFFRSWTAACEAAEAAE